MSDESLVCVDASTALAVVLMGDPLHSEVTAFFLGLSSKNVVLCAPAMFLYECDSIIRLQVHRGRLSRSEAQKARELLDSLGVRVDYDPAERERAYEIAEQYDQPRAYDASYAAYAEARGIELVTIDRPFFESVNGSKRPKNVPALGFVKLIGS